MLQRAFLLKHGVKIMPHKGQSQFADALIDPDAPLPEGIVDPDGKPAPKRFAVYRNNVIVSLTEALMASFPAVTALVGEDFFKQMARIFVQATPPSGPLLNEYGRDFPDFVAGFEPAQGLPFLPDVGQLDRAWLDAYHAADALPLDPAQLSGIDEAALVEMRFLPHPAMRLVVSQFPVVDIWNAGKSGQAAAGVDPTLHQTALVVRPDIEVGVHALTSAEGVFFSSLADGARLGEAAEAATSADAVFDLLRVLGLVISTGAFTSIQT